MALRKSYLHYYCSPGTAKNNNYLSHSYSTLHGTDNTRGSATAERPTLQGGLVMAKNERLELRDNILRTL